MHTQKIDVYVRKYKFSRVRTPHRPIFIIDFRGVSGTTIEHLIPILTFFDNL